MGKMSRLEWDVGCFLMACLFNLLMLVLFFYTIPVHTIMTARRRLNRYYNFSYDKKQQQYELHFSPRFFFAYVSSETYKKARKDAIRQFNTKFPNTPIISITMTLQDLYQEEGLTGIEVERSFKQVISSYGCIIQNVRNLRYPVKKLARLSKRVYAAQPKRYYIFN